MLVLGEARKLPIGWCLEWRAQAAPAVPLPGHEWIGQQKHPEQDGCNGIDQEAGRLVAIAGSRTLNLMFYPLLIATQSLPKVALAPLILVWLGLGIESKLAIAWLVAFFPIVVDTATGLRSTSPELLELARSLQCSRLQTFFKIQLPSALPSIFSGAKIAVTLAVIGAVIGEFIGSNEGLGNLLLTANSQLNTPLAWAALVVLSVLGMILYGAVVLAEKILMPWAPDGGHKV